MNQTSSGRSRNTLSTAGPRVVLRALIATLLLGTAAGSLGAPVYKTVDEQGNVIYTDDPRARGAREVELDDLTIVPSTAPLGEAAPDASVEQAAPEEEPPAFQIALLTPSQEATVRSNVGEVAVRARVQQPLRVGDVFEAIIDGQVRARSETGAFLLSGIDRGAHSVFVRLLDDSGRELVRSEQRTFYLHKISARNR